MTELTDTYDKINEEPKKRRQLHKGRKNSNIQRSLRAHV